MGHELCNKHHYLVGHSGNLCDSFRYHNNRYFTTWDADNDAASANCAKLYWGGFWYGSCHHLNPTGKYYNQPEASSGKIQFATGVSWYCYKGHYYSLKKISWQILTK